MSKIGNSDNCAEYLLSPLFDFKLGVGTDFSLSAFERNLAFRSARFFSVAEMTETEETCHTAVGVRNLLFSPHLFEFVVPLYHLRLPFLILSRHLLFGRGEKMIVRMVHVVVVKGSTGFFR